MVKKSSALRTKLLVWLLLPLLTLFGARAVYNYFVSARLSREVYDNALYDLARSLKQQIVFEKGRLTVNMSRSAYEILVFDQYDEVYFAVRDAAGKIFAGNENIPQPPHWSDTALDHHFYDGYLKGKEVRVVAIRVPEVSGQGSRFVLVEVAETLAKRRALTHEMIINILIPQIFIIILATIIIWFGVGKGLAPLQKLQIAVSKRSSRDLSAIEDKDIPEEAQPLIRSFNDLMSRLREALESQDRFIADAAHQLRTPVAGLLAQIRIALRHNDPEMSKHSMEQLYISAERIARLVYQLLALKRNDAGTETILRKNWIDLNQLVSEVVTEWVPEAVKNDIDLGFEGENLAVKVRGDAERIKEMLNNLLDNAIRYTQPKGRITARVFSRDGAPAFLVEDNGPGIPPEERSRVFERFYRLLGSKAGGSGLGLAIVRDIARAHNAEVTIAGNATGKGTVIKVLFQQGVTQSTEQN